MPRRALAIVMVLGFIACLSHASAADRYWISSTAKNWSDSSAWSSTSGGAGGASVPESGDNAFFDAGGAGNCTVSASISVDLIQVGSGYTGVVTLGSSVTVMTGAVVVDGTLRMGTNSKLQLMDSETPLTGTGTLDTATNSPNTVEYRGGDEVEVASTTPVSSYSNLTLTPPGGISRSAVFIGNANEQYFDMAAVDSAAGFLYVGSKNAPAKIVKIRLSDYTRVGTLTLASGENDLSPSVVVDSANGFLYAGTRTSPAKVVKVRLSDFTEVGAITLNTGENQLWSATLDGTNGYAYFGTRTSPARIIKVRLSDFTRESAITLASGENEALGAVIDEAAGFAYFGLQTTPAKVVKVRLSDFTAIATLTCNSGEDMVRVGVIDVAAGFAYFGLKTSPGKVVRVKLSDFTRDAVLTMNTGENKLYSGVIDPAGGFAYFGAYTNPGTVIKVKLDDFTRADAVTFGAGEKELDTAAIDVSSGYAYFMTDNWTGKAVKVNLSYVGAEWTHPSALDVNGNLSIGAGTLTSAGQGIALAGNWSNTGTFNPGLSTVTLDGGNQAVNGNNTFRNLSKTVTSAATLTFESGKAQQIAGTLDLQGASGNLLSLRASSAGQSWRLVAENYQATRFADIKETDASEGRSLIALSSTDNGNNQNVLFSSPAQVAFTTPAASATSPAWVEGTNSGDVSAVTVTVDSGTPFNGVRLSPTKWFADNASAGGASLGVSLSPSAATHVEVSVSNPFGNVNSASQNITWTATDLNGLSYSSDTVRIRKGDSLLLTATGAGIALEIDGHGDGTFEHSGTPGQKFPTLYSATGTFIARAKMDGVEVGSLTVVVIGVDLHGPVACQVDYQREKSVDVLPASEVSSAAFQPSDSFWMTVSVKEQTATGATLFLKTLRRGTPILEARLGGANGPLISRQGVDEFTLDVPARLGAVFDGDSGVGASELVLRPFIPNLVTDFLMFASSSTFENGVTAFQANTDSFTQEVDPLTGENIGRYRFEIWQPVGEDKFCFDVRVKQASSPLVTVGVQLGINGGSCRVFVRGGSYVVTESTDERGANLRSSGGVFVQDKEDWLPKLRTYAYRTEGAKREKAWRLKIVNMPCANGSNGDIGAPGTLLDARTGNCPAGADVLGPCNEKDLRLITRKKDGSAKCSDKFPADKCAPCDGQCREAEVHTGIKAGWAAAELQACNGLKVTSLPDFSRTTDRFFKIFRVDLDGYTGPGDSSTINPFAGACVNVSPGPGGGTVSTGVPFQVTVTGPPEEELKVRVYTALPGPPIATPSAHVRVSGSRTVSIAAGTTFASAFENCLELVMKTGSDCRATELLFLHADAVEANVSLEVQAEETRSICSGSALAESKVWVLADSEPLRVGTGADLDTAKTDESNEEAPGLLLARSNETPEALTVTLQPAPDSGEDIFLVLPDDTGVIKVKVNGSTKTGTIRIAASDTITVQSSNDQVGTRRITLRYRGCEDTINVSVVRNRLLILPKVSFLCVGDGVEVRAFRASDDSETATVDMTGVEANWEVSDDTRATINGAKTVANSKSVLLISVATSAAKNDLNLEAVDSSAGTPTADDRDEFDFTAVSVTIAPEAGQAGVNGDLVLTTGGNVHYVSPRGGGNVDLKASVQPGAVTFAEAFEWSGDVSSVAGDHAFVARSSPAKRIVGVRAKSESESDDCAQFTVWVIWSRITSVVGGLGSGRGLLDVGVAGPPHENGFFANYTIDFTHTISPRALFTDPDFPNLGGAFDATQPVPAATSIHPGTGLPLGGGAVNRWDNSRRIRARLLNPAAIPTDHLISPPGLWTGFPADYPADPVLGNDDSSVFDPETNDPYTNTAVLTGHDRPQLGVGDGGGADGDTVEMRYHFQEFTRVQIGTVWYLISDAFPWRFHFLARRAAGQWQDNGSGGATDNSGF